MKKFVLVMGLASVSLLSLVSMSRAEAVKEGQWSMTIVTKMPGMNEEMEAAMRDMSPEEKAMMQQMMGGNIAMNADSAGITTTTKQCVTNENPVPEVEEGCTSTHTLNGNTVNFEQTCPDSHSTGEITYQDETMHGTINSKQTEDGKTTDVTIELSGEYVGPCPAE